MHWFFTPWGAVLTIICVVHFIRRRPNTVWLWVILGLGWIGASAYILIEIVPDLGLDRPFRSYFVLRKRIELLDREVQQNPSAGNYEDLGLALLDDQQYARARECYEKAITPRTTHIDPYYRRALCEIALHDMPGALADLERVIQKEPAYDFQRAPGLLAHVYDALGRDEEAAALFTSTLEHTTLSETQSNYAAFLLKVGRKQEAKDWAQKVLDKRSSMAAYMRRRDSEWFGKAKGILKKV